MHDLHLRSLFSSACEARCTANVRDWQNPLPHSLHLNGLSFEWIYLIRQKVKKTVSKSIRKIKSAQKSSGSVKS